MATENAELLCQMSGVEEMVANLIVDQQAMAKSFQKCGNGHSGSLERHRTALNATRREIDRLQANQTTIVDECSVLQTQLESMGDNLCRSGLRKNPFDGSYRYRFLDAGNVAANAIGKRVVWSMPMMGPRDPITLPN